MKVHYLLILCIGLSLFEGLAELVGIPTFPYRLLIEAIIILLLYRAVQDNKNNLLAPGLKVFMGISLFFAASVLVNNSELLTSYRMYRNVLSPYMLFVAILNLNIKETSFIKVNTFIYAMLFIQIIASFFKYLAWGVTEGGLIGTFSTTTGALSTLFPLLSIIFLFLLFLLYKQRGIYVILVLGFLFMAWGGGKRAIVFLLPVFLVLTYLLYKKYEHKISLFNFKNVYLVGFIILISIPAFYILVIFTPTLNPERQYGGSFDINYAFNYALFYHMESHIHQGYSELTGAPLVLGRVATLNRSLELTTENKEKFLFGYGPSLIHGASRGDDALVYFGVVEFQTGLSRYIMAIGIPGALLVALLFVKIGIIALKNYHFLSNYWKVMSLGVFMSMLVFLFDYFMYSRAFVDGLIPSILFFYFAAAVLKQNKNQAAKQR